MRKSTALDAESPKLSPLSGWDLRQNSKQLGVSDVVVLVPYTVKKTIDGRRKRRDRGTDRGRQ